ncbi:hypothetical protein [Helicobacter sp. TUL]|uniref:hypothetical protein n=1 Tax=Helicobacter sp. TUL TaxID=1848928 RepID=UPI0021506C43|nr:hypothetical protein [Helicobacter sp. TUL]
MDRIDRRKFLHTISVLGLGILGGYSVVGCGNSNNKEKAMTTKDMFGNTIELDSNGRVIVRNYRYDVETIFDDERKKIVIDDKDFLQQEILRATNLLNQTNEILDSSPYANYKPIYFDPNLKTNPNHLKEYQALRNLYLTQPPIGAIAPWTKAEKAYYESLKTKRERYQYLVIRSGIRSSVIDIPLDAIANVDENGKLINEEYRELYEIVEANRGMAHISDGSLVEAEWEIAAGMLGDIKGFSAIRVDGFTARTYQKRVLVHQLGEIWEKGYYTDGYFFYGTYENPLRKAQMMSLAKKIKPDRFGMYPYIDEIMGVDWIMDYGRYVMYEDVMRELDDELIAGKLLDPRDPRATEQTRREFMNRTKFFLQRRAEASALNFPYLPEFNARFEDNLKNVYAKIRSITPPQGYPNAPTYYIPEYLDELYEAGKLDKKLNPTIPAIYRESFPQELRDKIQSYAKKHNIKE